MEEIIKVNKVRLPIVIGSGGSTKRIIEKKCGVSLEIDSHEGEVVIVSDKTYYEIYIAKKIVNAIARGFAPPLAFKLLEEDYSLEILHLTDYVGKHDKRLVQIKGRVIGTDGKIKKMIEKRYNCNLAVFGKTVAILAKYYFIGDVKTVIESILNGSKHTTAFKLMKLNSSGFKMSNISKAESKNDAHNIDNISFDE